MGKLLIQGGRVICPAQEIDETADVLVDGLKIAFTGDNILTSLSGPRLGGPIYRNRHEQVSFTKTIQRLLDFEPQMLLSGHSGTMSVDRRSLSQAYDRARQLEMAFPALVEEPEELGSRSRNAGAWDACRSGKFNIF